MIDPNGFEAGAVNDLPIDMSWVYLRLTPHDLACTHPSSIYSRLRAATCAWQAVSRSHIATSPAGTACAPPPQLTWVALFSRSCPVQRWQLAGMYALGIFLFFVFLVANYVSWRHYSASIQFVLTEPLVRPAFSPASDSAPICSPAYPATP